MRPQDNEPCINCMHWYDETGCEMGRYDSASMVMFGHCGFCRPKTTEEKPENGTE